MFLLFLLKTQQLCVNEDWIVYFLDAPILFCCWSLGGQHFTEEIELW